MAQAQDDGKMKKHLIDLSIKMTIFILSIMALIDTLENKHEGKDYHKVMIVFKSVDLYF